MADTFSRAERSRIMGLVKSRDTTPELVVRRLVHALGFRLRAPKIGTGAAKTPSQSPSWRYRLHVRSLPGAPDLVFVRLRKIILVSGCFWHMHGCGRCRIPASRRGYWVAKLERNAARDRRTRRALSKAGWRVLVVWECQTTPARRKRLRARLAAFLVGG